MEHNSVGTPPAGSIRFNTDTTKLEIYNGDKWWNVDSTSPQEQTGGTRGFILGGYANAPVSAYGEISYINVDTTGNAIDFGDLLAAGGKQGAGASRTRAVVFYANSPAKNTIEYFTMSTTGDAIDFGDSQYELDSTACLSNDTRGFQCGGYSNPGSGPYARVNQIEYITIASTGNAIDWGDMSSAQSDFDGCGNKTRGVLMGGTTTPSAGDRNNRIEYITMMTAGRGSDFGDLTQARSHNNAGSNAVRAICVQGINTTPSTTPVNTLDYVTIATLGNAVDFGDATTATITYGRATPTSPTRMVMACGGYSSSPYNINAMDYVQIMTTGNSVDFGDALPAAGLEAPSGISNGHGGLG